ncbi:MAG TPA: hypothetical protein VGI93_12130 [Steroidobacteraceae bacterium]|jgi:hypothetical protein
MRELLASHIYKQAANDLFATPPLSMQDLFNNSAVRYRVGKVITEAAAHPKYLDEKPATWD